MKNERGNNRKRNRDPRMPPCCSLDGGMFAHNLAGRLVKHETEAEKSKRGRIKCIEGQTGNRIHRAVDVQAFQGRAWPKRPHFDWRRICVARTDKQTLRMRQKLPPKQVNPLVYSPSKGVGTCLRSSVALLLLFIGFEFPFPNDHSWQHLASQPRGRGPLPATHSLTRSPTQSTNVGLT